MLLGSAINSNDAFTNMLMSGHSAVGPMFYSPNAYQYMPKQEDFYQSFNGMDSTLAPSVLDTSQNLPTTTDSSVPFHGTSQDDGLHVNFVDLKGVEFSGSQNSTSIADGTWDAFINDNSWSENGT